MLPDHVPIIEEKRVRLRPWRLDDAPVVQDVAGDPLVPLITSVPTSGSRADAEAFVRRQQGRLAEGAGYAFAIALRASDEAIGHIGLWTRDVTHGRTTTGYWLAPAHRRQGLLTEALATLTGWALSHDAVHRVGLYVEPWNEGSWRAAEACGYEREGLMRRWEVVGDEPRDMFGYGRSHPDPPKG